MSEPRPRAHLWALAGLGVVGAILRLEALRQDLFADELATYWITQTGGIGHVIRTIGTNAEITPPLSFVLAEISTWFGSSPALIRLPALVGGLVSIPLVYAVGSRTVGRTAGLVAAALVTVSPFMIYYSAEARGYGLLMALILLSTYSLLRAVDERATLWWVVYGVATCLACYTHYTGLFVLGVQAVWVLVVHPAVRKPALLATGAAVLVYLPWVPWFLADMRSPTTTLLGHLSPMDPHSVAMALGQWSLGFPAANLGWQLPYAISGSSLLDLPGAVSLLLLGAAVVVAVVAFLTRHEGPARSNRWLLVLALAVASPLGAALQSAVSTNVFRTRSMAPSWPFLALALAALVTARTGVLSRAATGLLVASVVAASVVLQSQTYDRPDFGDVVDVADAVDAGVIVNGATWTPGPLTNFEVKGTEPSMPVLRLTVPEQMEKPFWFDQPDPDPADIARRAVETAGDKPIVVAVYAPAKPAVDDFVKDLPPGYELTGTTVIPGIFRLEARVYEKTG